MVPLRVSLLNVQGFVTKRTNKLQTVEFQNIFSSSGIVLLTETWTNHYYRKENKKGNKRKSGGLILYIRNAFVSKDTLVYTSMDDIIWVKHSPLLCHSRR